MVAGKRRLVVVCCLHLLFSLLFLNAQSKEAPSRYLFVWARAADTSQPDFLAVMDVFPTSPTFGNVIASVSTGIPVNLAHHTNYEMPSDGILFASDFSAGIVFRFDLRDPRKPKLLGMFGNAGPYSHPHSFVRLANGHTLVTYQMWGFGNKQPGALVEVDAEGKVVRFADASDPTVDNFIRPYSLAVVPALDRVVTSSTDMYGTGVSHVVQVWRLSDLKRIKTIRLPLGPGGKEGISTNEPRVLPDNKTVLVSSANCGLYRITGLETEDPGAELVQDSGPDADCAVPAVVGKYWIQTVTHGKNQLPLLNLDGRDHPVAATAGAESHYLLALDVSDPAKPKEVSRLNLAPQEFPHWIAVDPNGKRLVLTGFENLQYQIVLVNIGEHGELSLDQRFHDAASGGLPGMRMQMDHWPHGGTGVAVPHGSVFSR